jgi:ATP-dependent DNA helicase RecG
MGLTKSLTCNASLALAGLLTPLDVLNHLPRRYESFAYTPKKNIYEDKERLVIKGYLKGNIKSLRFSHRSLTSFTLVTVEGETFLIEAWNRSYLAKNIKPDNLYSLLGIYNAKRHSLSLVNLVKGEVPQNEALRPIYSLPNDVPNYVFKRLVARCLETLKGQVNDIVPPSLARKYKLVSHYEALKLVHEPTSKQDIHDGLRVLKYEEALNFSLRTALVRGENRALKKDMRRHIDEALFSDFLKTLPYKLSVDQANVIKECLGDMNSPRVMYRLLQGDVGTGKTLVAACLAYANHLRNEQTALMAPTDALAKQHYENLSKLFKGTNLNIALLTGSTPGIDKAHIYQDLEDGTIDLIIGTHALFSSGVNFAYLGLAIIDEQHKFGVNQRSLLLGKGDNSDLLLMSATPIPRTLALSIYGDLDVSSLYCFPQGERKVKTYLVDSTSPKIKKAIDEALLTNHRVFIVTPQIEGNGEEDTSVLLTYEKFKKLYPGKVTLMHGELTNEDKDVAIAAFKSGLCPILVATSLIEVGIDVKEANTMIIYSASHFALSSLHQLRGRIGRDGSEASCYLVDNDSEVDDKEKLQVLLDTNDGFKIAEADLRLRGPGEIAGTKQSGLPDFNYANIINDFKIFECARNDASYILAHPDDEEFLDLITQAKEEIKNTNLD